MLKLFAQKTKKISDQHIQIKREDGDIIANVYCDAYIDVLTLGITLEEIKLIVNVSENFQLLYNNLPIR